MLKNINKWAALIAGNLILVVTLIIVIDSFGRFFFNKPLTGGVEISIFLAAFIVFLGLGYSLIQGTHPQLTILLRVLPFKLKVISEIFIHIIGLFFMGLSFYATWKQFYESWSARETMAAAINIPFWVSKLALPLGFFLITVQFGFNLIIYIKKLIRGED